MTLLRAIAPLALLAVVGGCDAGITSTGGGRLVSYTPGFPDGDGCALHSDGTALCRGTNQYGRLGIGTAAEGTVSPSNAISVDGAARFQAIATGNEHACALDGDGAAWCWGSNAYGELGVNDTTGPERCDATLSYYPAVVHGTIACATRPVRVATPLHFRALTLQYDESCGLTTDGQLWCWGALDDGFGLAGATPPAPCAGISCPVPVRAASGLTFRKVVGDGGGTCGIAEGLQLYCWGNDYYGRFGRDTASTAAWDAPTPINSSAAIRDVAIAADHTCTVTTAGALMCFGANWTGQLGDGTTISRTTPKQTDPTIPLVRIAVAQGRSCALDLDGKAWCWGRNDDGRLGVGTTLLTLAPASVLGGLTFRSISLGGSICGSRSDGIWCWGQLPSRFEQ